MIDKNDVFEDFMGAMDFWTSAVTDALLSRDADLRWVDDRGPFDRVARALAAGHVDDADVRAIISECLVGYANSLLTVIDGGSASAEIVRVHLVDSAGRSLGEGLHEYFMQYLLDAGRI
jgi:hypothetical protein